MHIDPLKIFIAVFMGLVIGILVYLIVAASVAGDWYTAVFGTVGAICTAGLAWDTLRS